MTLRRATAAVAAALLLLSACSGQEPGTPTTEATGSAEPSTTSTPNRPEYAGTVPVGLAAEPSWAVEDTGDVHAFADVVAIRNYHEGPAFRLYDLASGEPRTEIKVSAEVKEALSGSETDAEVWSGTWEGTPALYTAYTIATESDGLSEEQETRFIDAYDADGEQLGSVSGNDTGSARFSVVNGWVLRAPDDASDATITTPDGEVVVESLCGQIGTVLNCEVDHSGNLVTYPREAMVAIAGDIAFQKEDRGEGSRLVAIDLNTGEPAWTSDDIEAPDDVPPATEVEGLNAYPAAHVDDSVVLHWRHSIDGIYAGVHETTISVHDLATGELTMTGPTLDVADGSGVDIDSTPAYLLNGDDTVAVLRGSPDSTHASAIDLTSGELLWQQDRAERDLFPHAIIGDVLFAYRTDDEGEPIAVGLTTKEVLLEDFTNGDEEDTPVPAALPGGDGLIRANGTFVFAAAS